MMLCMYHVADDDKVRCVRHAVQITQQVGSVSLYTGEQSRTFWWWCDVHAPADAKPVDRVFDEAGEYIEGSDDT